MLYQFCDMLMPRDYDSFAPAILSQNHRGIDSAESLLAGINVIVACTKGFS